MSARLRFGRDRCVYLTSAKAEEVIGAVVEGVRVGPRGGMFAVWDWKAAPGCPVHLSAHINTATRMKSIHGELLNRHYPRVSNPPTGASSEGRG